jgi:hypothetical protein
MSLLGLIPVRLFHCQLNDRLNYNPGLSALASPGNSNRFFNIEVESNYGSSTANYIERMDELNTPLGSSAGMFSCITPSESAYVTCPLPFLRFHL